MQKRLTLRQFMVLQGFDRPADLIAKAAELKSPVPQPAVSAMMRGDLSYPKARASVALALGIQESRLLELIGESGEAARRKMTPTK